MSLLRIRNAWNQIMVQSRVSRLLIMLSDIANRLCTELHIVQCNVHRSITLFLSTSIVSQLHRE